MNKRIRKKHADRQRRAYRSLFSAAEIAFIRSLTHHERDMLTLFRGLSTPPLDQVQPSLTTDTFLGAVFEYCHDDFQCFCGAS